MVHSPTLSNSSSSTHVSRTAHPNQRALSPLDDDAGQLGSTAKSTGLPSHRQTLEKSVGTRTYALEGLSAYRAGRGVVGVGDFRSAGGNTTDATGKMFGDKIIRDRGHLVDVSKYCFFPLRAEEFESRNGQGAIAARFSAASGCCLVP